MNASDIADLAGVQRATVSNWRKRHDDFPEPLPGSSPRQLHFDASAVRAWLEQRYPDTLRVDDPATEAVRTWRYMMSDTVSVVSSSALILLIAAAEGQKIDYTDDGSDQSHPVTILADIDPMVGEAVHARRSQAEAIRHFLTTDIASIDKAQLIDAAAEEFDDLLRWRRTPEAVAAERNLHTMLAELVHLESGNVLDMACRTGALLKAVSREHANIALVGMDANPDFAYIAEARMQTHADAEIDCANSLYPGVLDGRTFDAVVSIPPVELNETADGVWLQIAAQALTPDGEAFLVLPHTLTSSPRADRVRRELIRQGLVAAVVTLPSNALAGSRVPADLWVLTRRRDRSAPVLMVDYSQVKPDNDDAYGPLRHELSNWLDAGGPPEAPDGAAGELPRRFVGADVPYVDADPLELLGSTVILDPQYWCARAATSTSAPELIDATNDARDTLVNARAALTELRFPADSFVPESSVLISVRAARDDGLLDTIRQVTPTKDRRNPSAERPDVPVLQIADAEAMWRGEHFDSAPDVTTDSAGFVDAVRCVRVGDILVWATAERDVRAVVCTVDGFAPAANITVLRCGPDIDAEYLALVITSGINAIHVTGSSVPVLRGLDLCFPLISMEAQRRVAHYERFTRQIRKAAHDVITAVDALQQRLADAAGSGAVGVTGEGSGS